MNLLTNSTDLPAPGGPLAAPRVIRQRRVRRGALSLAVLAMALGGLIVGYAYQATTRVQDVLAVARAVPVGTQLSAADVTTVQITTAVGLSPIPASQLRHVLAERAAVALVPGTLLTGAQLTDKKLVGPGERQVSLGLTTARLPARTLHPGDQVQLVALASAAGDVSTSGSGGLATAAPATYDATVVDILANTSTSTTSVVLYLAVAETDAAQVVTLAAQNRVAVVLKGGS